MKKALLLTTLIFALGESIFAFGLREEIEISSETNELIAPTEAVTYEWFLNGKKIRSADHKLKVTKSGTYKVNMVDAMGESATASITVKVNNDGQVYRVWTIGDSTMQTYDPFWKPRQGWGAVLQPFFDPTHVEVINRGAGGTSSKSFYENNWKEIVPELKEGDFVFIQFGINDRYRSDPARYTDPTLSSDQVGATKYYLKKFVDESIQKGAYPVLATTIRRNDWSGDVNSDGYGAYAQAARELSYELDVPLLDIDSLGKIAMEEVGPEYSGPFWYMNFPAGVYPYPWADGQSDVIHIQEMGAIQYAKLAVEGIKLNDQDTMMMNLVEHLAPTYEVTTSALFPNETLITRSGSFPAGLNITLRAFYDTSTYVFAGWYDGSDTRVTKETRYEFTMGEEAVSFQAKIDSDKSKIDCTGEYEGGAYIDDCGVCVEGSTPRKPCSTEFETGISLNISSANSGLCLSPGEQITQEACIGDLSQSWQLVSVDGSFYKIKNDSSDLLIERDGSFLALGLTGSDWLLEPSDDGFYRIIPRGDVENNLAVSRLNEGAPVGIIPRRDNLSHLFSIEPAMEPLKLEMGIGKLNFYPNPVSDGTLSIQIGHEFNKPSVQIIKLDGKVIFEEDLLPGMSELNLTQVKEGIYLIRLLDEGSVVSKGKLLVE